MYGLDGVQLHDLAADHLQRRLLPLLDDPAAKGETEALVGILRRARFGREVDALAGRGWPPDAATDGLAATRDALSGFVARMNGGVPEADVDARDTVSDEALTAHLRERFGNPGLRAAGVRLVGGGFSKQTMLFDKVDDGDGTVERLVLRRDYPDSPVETSVRDEFPAVCDLHAAGIAMPEPLWLDEGRDGVPGPFFVSRRVPGSRSATPPRARAPT